MIQDFGTAAIGERRKARRDLRVDCGITALFERLFVWATRNSR